MHFSFVLLLFVGGEIVDLVLETGPVAKVVLFLLIAFSVLSWGVILSKWRLISAGLAPRVGASSAPSARHSACRISPRSPISSTRARWSECSRAPSQSSSVRWGRPVASRIRSPSSAPCRLLLPRRFHASNATFLARDYGRGYTVYRTLRYSMGNHRRRSTDWGWLARQRCAQSLPEFLKLVTTAAGLAAAIPAVIAYNLIIGSIREMAARNDDFALEMLNLVESQQAQQLAEARR